jgi:hypothetical protein
VVRGARNDCVETLGAEEHVRSEPTVKGKPGQKTNPVIICCAYKVFKILLKNSNV